MQALKREVYVPGSHHMGSGAAVLVAKFSGQAGGVKVNPEKPVSTRRPDNSMVRNIASGKISAVPSMEQKPQSGHPLE